MSVRSSKYLFLSACISALVANGAFAQQADDIPQAILASAEALGGVDAIRDLETLEMLGYAQRAYQWGGGNISGDPRAPQKWQAANELRWAWNLDKDQFFRTERRNFLFPFAAPFGHNFAPVDQYLDGDIAYDIRNGEQVRTPEMAVNVLVADGRRQRELWSQTNPAVLVHNILTGEMTASNERSEDGNILFDVEGDGVTLTLAIDEATMRPDWVSWAVPHDNLGQVELQTNFVAYMPYDGIYLPMGATTVMDWRDQVFFSLFVDGYIVNGEVADISATDEVAAAPVPEPATPQIEVEQLADGVWRLTGGTTVVEFSDHLLLFELGGNQPQGQAVIETANSLVDGKKATEFIVSHHHFDHTAGFRPAVAEGMTFYSRQGVLDILSEAAARPVPDFEGDTIPEGGSFEGIAVEEPYTIEDEMRTLVIYPIVSNNHIGDGVFAYLPEEKIMIEGDIGTAAEEWQFWADSYEDNIEHWDIEVDMISPVHAYVMSHEELLDFIEPGRQRVQERCAAYVEQGEPLPGCPAFLPRGN